MWRTPKFAKNLPQQIATDRVKCFYEVDEGNENNTTLYPAFYLEKSCNGNPISSAGRARKAALRLGNYYVNDECRRRRLSTAPVRILPVT